MTNFPADLTPEAAAWMHAQIAISNARSAAILRDEIRKVDDWADGIFVALRDVVGNLLFDTNDLGRDLGRSWARAASRFEQISDHGDTPDIGESPELLEARKILFNLYSSIGVMPKNGR